MNGTGIDSWPRMSARKINPRGAAISQAARTRPSHVPLLPGSGSLNAPISQAATLHGIATARVVVNKLGSEPIMFMSWSRWPMKTNNSNTSQSPASNPAENPFLVELTIFLTLPSLIAAVKPKKGETAAGCVVVIVAARISYLERP